MGTRSGKFVRRWNRLRKEIKAVYNLWIKVSVMSFENRMYLTQLYQFFFSDRDLSNNQLKDLSQDIFSNNTHLVQL